ncbi:hypothetical protein [Pseudomonas kribbensis]|uniref:HNH endonuclease n=1 Tax=Pseudomonas kribbensis TaxID=1628086 RepID=A0A4Y8VKH4_9PSED|nr:hypothetical protein [Pseudomonas kribbensis]TFH80957.1 hypothetical protein E4J90_11920 [Pseudomonas kribbensis]
MINIKKHLESITTDVSALLSEIVEELWNDLNPKNTDGTYSERSLIRCVEKYRLTLDDPEYIKLAGNAVVARQVTYMDYIANIDNLKNIITASPAQLDDVIAKANEILEPGDLLITLDEKIHKDSFGPNLLSQVFKYDNYRGSGHCTNRYRKLGFDKATCPYCNEATMKIVPKEDEEKFDQFMLFDIDHFYSKSAHPYLALSFYNHIPSCKACNQTYKGKNEFSFATHIHPYHRCFDTLYSFQLNHGVLRSDPPTTVKVTKKSDFEEKLLADLQIERRYRTNLEHARLSQLVKILSNYSHILRDGAENDDDRVRLKERLEDFGLIATQKHILSQCYSKLQRDTLAMFDPNNTLGLL